MKPYTYLFNRQNVSHFVKHRQQQYVRQAYCLFQTGGLFGERELELKGP